MLFLPLSLLQVSSVPVQIVNAVFWLVPHAVVLSASCSWFNVIINVSGVIRWTIWNLVRC